MGLMHSTLRLLRDRNRRHYSFNLLRDATQRKYIFRWLESLENGYFLKKMQPWLAFEAIDFLKSLPLNGKQVFEYGSGGSTLYWLSRGMMCVSVEHDAGWYNSVRNLFHESMDVDYRLVQPEKSNSDVLSDIANPHLYLSGDAASQGYFFKNYVSQIDDFPNDYFDIVLIDGRSRPACIMHSVAKVKVGGFLVLDNSDIRYYLDKTYTFLRNFDRKTFRGATPGSSWYTETSVFTRKT